MYSLIALVHLDGDAAPVLAALAGLGAAVAPVLEGSFNGGDVSAIWHFASMEAHRTARAKIDAVLSGPGIVRADICFYEHGPSGVAEPGMAKGVHRTLFLCADHEPTEPRLAQFEAEMVQMPRYIPAIRNWRLSRVIEANGELAWTHVWEQEYADPGGLMGPYMVHPYHWGFIDRWFDPECPDWLVHPQLCHNYAAYGRAIIGSEPANAG